MKKIVLLHGALGSQAQMMPLADLLRQGFEVYSFNFSGHGGAPFYEAFSIEQFTSELLSFMDSNGLAKPAIFGYSMGGYVALDLARFYPERAGKIVTLGTKFDWTPESAAKEVRMLDPEAIATKVPAFAAQLESRHAPNDWKLLVKKTAQMMLDLGQKPSLTPLSLPSIHHEALICLGENDNMVSQEETTQVAHLLPNGEMKVLAQTPHVFEKVEMEKLADAITDFLSVY